MTAFLYKILCGFFLGVSVFAPGFSGSLVAIIMGIYQDIVRIASNPFKKLKENIIFCLPLGIGAAISAILFVLAFQYLFETYEKATYLLFVGLIAGNLPIIIKEIKKSGYQRKHLVGGIGAMATALALSLAADMYGQSPEPASIVIWALGGLAAGVTALMPGMSVSMVLILMGIYSPLLSAARTLLDMNFEYLIPFGLFCGCAVIGLVAASKGIKAIFEKLPGLANTMVLGFMSGSLLGIIYNSHHIDDAGFTWLIGGVALAIGLGISMMFVWLGGKMGHD
jgi:putative membrane protein